MQNSESETRKLETREVETRELETREVETRELETHEVETKPVSNNTPVELGRGTGNINNSLNELKGCQVTIAKMFIEATGKKFTYSELRRLYG